MTATASAAPGAATVTLARNTNQALGIGQFAIDFMKRGRPSEAVLARTRLFHTDAVLCGLSALALPCITHLSTPGCLFMGPNQGAFYRPAFV